MKREIIVTEDGSHSIFVEELRENFHSDRGSIQESEHTFIKAGLEYALDTFGFKELNIFEVGFGTGLNALLTLLKADQLAVPVNYDGIDAFPLEANIYHKLNYEELINGLEPGILNRINDLSWNEIHEITSTFKLKKIEADLLSHDLLSSYQLIYFDAFAPSVQPELWSQRVFDKLYGALDHHGVLVTYSAAGAPRRAMQKAGFWIDEIRGAIGKREMTRAVKF